MCRNDHLLLQLPLPCALPPNFAANATWIVFFEAHPHTLLHLLVQVQQQCDQGLDVLKIIMEQLCLEHKLNAALVCRLLCCSTATAELVHQTCAGQLAVTSSKMYHKGSAWLAKHARLLRELSLTGTWEGLEEWVAAGLCAAAGASDTLPLQQLQLEGKLESEHLHTVISDCCTQLTLLHATCVPGLYTSSPTAFPVDFSLLHNLRELRISCTKPWTDATLQSMSSLTQLTTLHTPPLELENVFFEELPVSLVELAVPEDRDEDDRGYEAAFAYEDDMQHLTNLTYLQLSAVEGPEQLPQQLRELRVRDFEWDEGFLELPQLCSLRFAIHGDSANFEINFLTELTELTALGLSLMTSPGRESDVFIECSLLPELPLVQLRCRSVWFYDHPDFSCVAQCTQLTELVLHDSFLNFSLVSFAEELRRLRNLERLTLINVRCHPRPEQDHHFKPLLDVISNLCLGELRYVKLSTGLCGSKEQQSSLQGLLGDALVLDIVEMPYDPEADYQSESVSDGSEQVPGDSESASCGNSSGPVSGEDSGSCDESD
jgi:hypothetical protein